MLIDQVFIFLDFIFPKSTNNAESFRLIQNRSLPKKVKIRPFFDRSSLKDFFVKRKSFRHDEIFIFWIVLWKQALWWPVNKQLIGLEAKRDLIPRFQNLQKLHIRNDWIMWHEKIFLASKFILDSFLYKSVGKINIFRPKIPFSAYRHVKNGSYEKYTVLEMKVNGLFENYSLIVCFCQKWRQ